MKITEESLHKKYSSMETEALLELLHTSDLTDMAKNVLERTLSERGVAPDERNKLAESVKNKVTLNTPPLASIGSRIAAKLIDNVVTLVILVMPELVFRMVSADKSILGVLIGMFASTLYLLLQDGLPNGQSIGKRLLKIAVVDKSSGKNCGIVASIIRNIFLVLSVIDFLFIASTYRQRLGDMSANTIVVNAAKKSA